MDELFYFRWTAVSMRLSRLHESVHTVRPVEDAPTAAHGREAVPLHGGRLWDAVHTRKQTLSGSSVRDAHQVGRFRSEAGLRQHGPSARRFEVARALQDVARARRKNAQQEREQEEALERQLGES